MNVTGSCHCGEIQFEATIDPKRVGICHCTDCQIFSSAPFRTSALVVGEQFHLVRGQPATYLKTAESGNQRNLAFCGRCGTHLYAAPTSGTISFYSVRVGVLSERAQIRPVAQLWCQSELSWLSDISNLHRVESQ
jgi:hypothetical protein